MCVITYSSGSMGFSAREENAIESTLPLAPCTLTLPLPPLRGELGNAPRLVSAVTEFVVNIASAEILGRNLKFFVTIPHGISQSMGWSRNSEKR